MENDNTNIDMSYWTLDRIQEEQYKHVSFISTGVMPTVDKKQIFNNLDPLKTALDNYIKQINEDTEIYIICEMAKLYLMSLRKGKWNLNIKWQDYECSLCGHSVRPYFGALPNYCANCGAQMERRK